MAWFFSGGGRLHYQVDGAGPLLILLHNGFYSSESWNPVLPFLAENFTCVSWDRWGYGKSAPGMALRGDIASGVEELDDLLAQLASDGLDTDHPLFCGHCLGGAIAATWVAHNPDRCPALVLEATGFFSDELLRHRIAVVIRPWEALPEVLQKTLIHMHGRLKAQEAWNYIMTWDDDYIANAAYDLRPILSAITCPTLVVTGDKDVYFKPKHTREGFRHLALAELWIPPGVGHDVHHEIPEEFATRLSNWFGVPLP
jgi:3-oxoadipate enol-lactonase